MENNWPLFREYRNRIIGCNWEHSVLRSNGAIAKHAKCVFDGRDFFFVRLPARFAKSAGYEV